MYIYKKLLIIQIFQYLSSTNNKPKVEYIIYSFTLALKLKYLC